MVVVIGVMLVVCLVPPSVYVAYHRWIDDAVADVDSSMEDRIKRVADLEESKKIFRYVMALVVIALVIVVYVLLITSFRVIKGRAIPEAQLTSVNCKTTREAKKLLRERKKNLNLLKIFVTMCTLYGVTFLPYNIIVTLIDTAADEGVSDVYFTLEVVFLFIYFLSAVVNPLVTLFGKPDFAKTILGICCSKRRTLQKGEASSVNSFSHDTMASSQL